VDGEKKTPSNKYIIVVLCLVPNAACVSGLPMLDCPFGFLKQLYNWIGDICKFMHLFTVANIMKILGR
jgi:hypothetical protein